MVTVYVLEVNITPVSLSVRKTGAISVYSVDKVSCFFCEVKGVKLKLFIDSW